MKKERNPVVKKLKVDSDDAASNSSSVSNSGQQGKKKSNGPKKNKETKLKVGVTRLLVEPRCEKTCHRDF